MTQQLKVIGADTVIYQIQVLGGINGQPSVIIFTQLQHTNRSQRPGGALGRVIALEGAVDSRTCAPRGFSQCWAQRGRE